MQKILDLPKLAGYCIEKVIALPSF